MAFKATTVAVTSKLGEIQVVDLSNMQTLINSTSNPASIALSSEAQPDTTVRFQDRVIHE